MKIERLRQLREKRGLSQSEAAKRMGIVRTTYSNYEAGNREPDFETIKKIAEFFDVSIDYLLEQDENKYNDADTIIDESGSANDLIKLREELQKISGIPKSEERKKKVAEFMQEFLKLPDEIQDNFYDLIKNMPKK